MREFHSGAIWMAIRGSLLQCRERLIQAFDASSDETEAALLDDIAREITRKVEPMVRNWQQVKLEQERLNLTKRLAEIEAQLSGENRSI